MRLKRNAYWLIAACLAFMAVSIRALRAHEGHDEEARPPAALSDEYVDILNARLKFSDKQRQKISGIVKETQPAMRKKFEQLKAAQEQMRSFQKDLQTQMRDSSERIRAELNNEQKDAFDELKLQMRHPMRMGPGPWGNPGMMRPDQPRPSGREMDDMMGPPEMWHGPREKPEGDKPEKQQ